VKFYEKLANAILQSKSLQEKAIKIEEKAKDALKLIRVPQGVTRW